MTATLMTQMHVRTSAAFVQSRAAAEGFNRLASRAVTMAIMTIPMTALMGPVVPVSLHSVGTASSTRLTGV